MTLATPTTSPSPDAETSLRLPLGLASPLWLMIGSAAMIGATFFWATRWMRPGAIEVEPVLPKLEPEVQAATDKAVALMKAATELAVETAPEASLEAPFETVIDPVTEAPVVVAKAIVETAPEPLALTEPEVEPQAEIEVEPEAVIEREPDAEAEPEPVAVAEAEPEVERGAEPEVETIQAAADDLTRLAGVGAKMAANLAERGVTTFAQIAAWTEDEVLVLDKEMKLMGRIGRDAWVAQAKLLAKG
jgi:predicted flap endonuclease-1-like 5' DNA nuclease